MGKIAYGVADGTGGVSIKSHVSVQIQKNYMKKAKNEKLIANQVAGL